MDQHQEQQYYYQLGMNIQEARKAAGMSQETLANKVAISRTSIVNIEKGRHRIPAHMLVLIAEALTAKLDVILPSRTAVVNGNKIVSATLPRIISDNGTVDPETEQAVANFVLFLNNK